LGLFQTESFRKFILSEINEEIVRKMAEGMKQHLKLRYRLNIILPSLKETGREGVDWT
jgi:hypothetical protein